MSLNKGSLDKSQRDQKLDIEYLYTDFIAGENITAGQILMIDDAADNAVLVATFDAGQLVCGVALNDALITELVEVCIYGVVEVTAAEDIYSGDAISVGATAGRAYYGSRITSGPGSIHKHTESLTVSAPSGEYTDVAHGLTIHDDFCAETSGASPEKAFYSIQAQSIGDVSANNHSHTIGGSIDNEALHTHTNIPAQTLGKALESFTAGNTGKILVCLS